MFTEREIKLIKIAIYERENNLSRVKTEHPLDIFLLDTIDKIIKDHTSLLKKLSELEKEL